MREELRTNRASFLLSIGFSGALDPTLRTGDIVVSERILADGHNPVDLDATFAQATLRALSNGGVRVHDGPTITVREPVLTASGKADLHERTGAAAVDMETYWIATEATNADVPMVSARTIIDEAHQNLPRFAAAIMSDGGRHELQHALKALRNPANIKPMISMAIKAKRARSATKPVLDMWFPTRYVDDVGRIGSPR